MLRTLAAWSYRRRRAVVVAWVIILIGSWGLAKTVGGDLLKTFSLPGTESQRTFDTLKETFGQTGDTGQLVFKVKNGGGVASPQTKAEVDAIIAKLKAVKNNHIASVTTPWNQQPGDQLRLDARSEHRVRRDPVRRAVERRAGRGGELDAVGREGSNSPTLQVELGGSMFTDQTQPPSEVIGILAAVFILLIAFGSVLAMGLPIMTALFGIGTGLAVVTLLARVLDVPSFAPQVTAMIGIGVGIDYALFISTRYREALHEGAEPRSGGRPRDRHERSRRAVRRQHRRDLAARPVPHRRVVHPWPRGRAHRSQCCS